MRTSRTIKKTTAQGKIYYDQKRQSSVLSPDDQVLEKEYVKQEHAESSIVNMLMPCNALPIKEPTQNTG